MYNRIACFLFCCVFFVASVCRAQNFGGFPPSVHWQQFNTDTARILFTPAARQQAMRIAQLVHTMAADTPVTMGSGLKKINIVLHSNTTLANGYVALGPFRSEYYLVPGGDIFEFGNLPWHENLAVHEYRHVQQYNNYRNGLTKVFTALAGQNGRALANALTIPDWFFEGDAVYAETAFTGMGRGRQPLFLSNYNSLWEAGKNYRWMKLRNGSYKDYVPNHYPLGYLLVNYGYLKKGPEFWKYVSGDASRFRGLFYPFQQAVQRYSHEDFKKFRKEALQFYKDQVPEQPIMVTDKVVTNYYFPQAIGTDSLLYLKESYRSLPAFYIKDKRGEHRLKLRNISTENWFRYAAGKMVYTTYNTNKRWSLIDYSDIVLLDIRTKHETQLTHKGKYYTPDLSPDGTQVIAVSFNDSLQTELQLINTSNGDVLKKFVSAAGDFFVHPKFINGQEIVVGVRTPGGLLSLQRLNVAESTTTELIAPQQGAIGNPSVNGDTLFFTASFSGNDDLYAYTLTNKKLYQLTTGKTGNYYPTAYQGSLVWSKFTAMGMQLQQQLLQNLLWKEIEFVQPSKEAEGFPVAASPLNVLKKPDTRTFTQLHYSKATGLLNFHSWDPGLNLYSNNILNTLAANVYYRYNESEKAHTTGLTVAYGGFFPVLSASVEQTFSRHVKTGTQTIVANENESSFGYNIPLNFTKGKTLKYLNFGSAYVFKNFQPIGASKNEVSNQQSQYLHHFISWSQQLQRARQDIYPKLGFATTLHYRHRIDGWGYQALTSAAVYLPAFSKTHSLVLSGSFQQVDTGNVLFSNRFSLARGYPDYYYTRMWNASFNYHMPLLYPDWGAANILYFMRVRSNFFFDYSRVRSRTGATNTALRSTGAEIYFDTKWWNQLPVSFGVRYSYLLNKEFAPNSRHVFEFVVPVDLIPF